MERWDRDVKPGATGFLGTTAGVASDGTAIAFVRFVDEAAARWNEGRPEQVAWWHELAEVLDGPPMVTESADVALLLAGGSDDAGFVQIARAARPDRDQIDALMTPDRIAAVQRRRPDLIGSIRAWLDDGSFLEAAYFKAEPAARDAEHSDDDQNAEALFAAACGPVTFVDLPAPILVSA
jgi:hypothetical protein